MSWGWAVFTYLVVWWITLLPMLNIGLTHAPDKPPEQYQAAPDRANLKKKMILNSVVAALVVLGIHLFLESGIIPLRGVR